VTDVSPGGASTGVEDRVLDAVLECSQRWGYERMTIDDVVERSGVSRATIYRLFPGGREVLFEALRVRELDRFFADLRAEVETADTLDDIVVRAVVGATRALRDDEHLAAMLAAEPGEMLSQLTVDGVPRIIRMATASLTPLVASHLGPARSRALIDVLARLTISYFLAPSPLVDLGDEASARPFLAPMLREFSPPSTATH
jgi:AcrR family transcriptional regulator